MEHHEQADRMEEEADRLEDHADEVGDRIDETRKDWEARQQDPSVPGAKPPDDAERGSDREEAVENPGAADDEGTATGNPDAAGTDE